MIIDGKNIAEEISNSLKARYKKLSEQRFFGAILVGEDAASMNFLKQKERVAKEIGIDFRLYRYPSETKTDDLRAEIGRLSGVRSCGGFIAQLPFPGHIQTHYVLNAIPKDKDPDLLSEAALGAFYTGRRELLPPSVGTVKELLARYDADDLRTKTAAVIGTGFLIGKPIAFYLQDKVGELMVFDSKSKNLREALRAADVVISGAGVPGLFGPEHLKHGTLVLDFGYGKDGSGKLCGDFNASNLEHQTLSITYTPTPGGTGPILVAKLFENFITLNEK